jgi:hypothetical protein
MLRTVPEISYEIPDRAYFTFDNRDSAEGLPPLLRSWFYPGDNTGWTFVYARSQRRPADYRTSVAASPSKLSIFNLPNLPFDVLFPPFNASLTYAKSMR